MDQPIRTRFAPSPTGFPHVGNIRTALFAWLFARHHGGKFIVRIEDTDVARKVAGATEAILASLRWLGLDWDEGPEVGGDCGPYFQSQRLPLYQQAAARLVAEGKAYRCYCSPERLQKMREEQTARKQPPGYDRTCRGLSAAERASREAAGIRPVVRFRTPLEDNTAYHDLIWGEVSFANSTIDDFVLLKSDGYPTYHLANVVDDRAMKISHVLRAEEWISSTPRHLLLYGALDYAPPQYAHLPMLLSADRSKLSKRHGAVAVTEYQQQGFLPEALFNFLALLGWSLDDRTEIMSREQIIANFSLERVSKTAAIFNHDKLLWMNGSYLRSLELADLVRRVMPFLEKSGLPAADPDYLREIMPLVRERVKKLEEVPALTEFFFTDDLSYQKELLTGKELDAETAARALAAAEARLEGLGEFDAGSLEAVLRPLAGELGLKTGQLFGVLRTAVTGRTAAPPLFQTMAVLGRERCLKRISQALEKIRGS